MLQKRGKFVDVSLKKKRVAHSNAKVVNADEYLYTAAGDLTVEYYTLISLLQVVREPVKLRTATHSASSSVSAMNTSAPVFKVTCKFTKFVCKNIP